MHEEQLITGLREAQDKPAVWYSRFATLLAERLKEGSYTTEDAVRYCFHLGLLQESVVPHHRIILEFPHPSVNGAEVDTWIEPTEKEKGLAVEFKYDRKLPGQGTINKTQRAGKVFHDLYRLSKISTDYTRVFIYVATREMNIYFRNSAELNMFYDPPVGASFVFPRNTIEQCARVLVEAAGPGPDLNLSLEFMRPLPEEHEVRIYQINNT